MANFSPNLEDGEPLLPSDISFEEIIYTHRNPTGSIPRRASSPVSSPTFPCELTYMEELAQQLATYALLERNRTQDPPKPRPSATQLRSVRLLRTSFGSPAGLGNDLAGLGNGGLEPGWRPGYQFYPVKPVPVQVLQQKSSLEVLMEERKRVLQRQEQNPVQNRFLPSRPSNGIRLGRKSGGTGVFLPRPFLLPEVRGNSIMNGAQEQSAMRNLANQGMTLQPASCEMGLPQDWSY